jgi:hypothetical protein
VGAAFAVHGAVALLLEVPSGVLADTLGRRRVLLAGAALTAVSLAVFAFADALVAFIASLAALAAGRALISGALDAWYVDSLRALDPSAPLAAGLSRGTAGGGRGARPRLAGRRGDRDGLGLHLHRPRCVGRCGPLPRRGGVARAGDASAGARAPRRCPNACARPERRGHGAGGGGRR